MQEGFQDLKWKDKIHLIQMCHHMNKYAFPWQNIDEKSKRSVNLREWSSVQPPVGYILLNDIGITVNSGLLQSKGWQHMIFLSEMECNQNKRWSII